MIWAAFGVGIVVGLGIAAILHGLFDDVSNYYKTKKTAGAATPTDRRERK